MRENYVVICPQCNTNSTFSTHPLEAVRKEKPELKIG